MTRRRCTFLAFLLLLTAGAAAFSPQQSPADSVAPIVIPKPSREWITGLGATNGRSTIRGRVLAAESGVPLRRAHVTLSATPRIVTLLTDDEGAYEFKGLAAGAYTVSAAKNGYTPAWYARPASHSSLPETINLAADLTANAIDIALTRAGVIVVRLVDASGEPWPQATLRVRRKDVVPAPRSSQNLDSVWSGMSPATNDQGIQRLYGLEPGEYYLIATVRSSPGAAAWSGTSEKFYPGADSLSGANPISVEAGQEVHVTFQINQP